MGATKGDGEGDKWEQEWASYRRAIKEEEEAAKLYDDANESSRVLLKDIEIQQKELEEASKEVHRSQNQRRQAEAIIAAAKACEAAQSDRQERLAGQIATWLVHQNEVLEAGAAHASAMANLILAKKAVKKLMRGD